MRRAGPEAGELDHDARAAERRLRRPDATAVRADDRRARSRGRGRFRRRCGRARGRRDGSGRRRARARRAAMPGSVVVDPDRARDRRRRWRAPSSMRPPGWVCSIALRSRLRSAWVTRSRSALRIPAAWRSAAKRRSAVGWALASRSASSGSRSIGSRWTRRDSSVCASSRRSSVRRVMRSTSAATRRCDAADLLLIGVRVAREHLDLAADRGQRRAQLVRGVGGERLLAREGLLEAVEHVVEGVREDPRLVAAGRGRRCAGRGRRRRRARRSAPSAAAAGRTRLARPKPSEQRERERDRAADREAAEDPVERVVDRRERLADGESRDLAAR